jgi:hypothetical protein
MEKGWGGECDEATPRQQSAGGEKRGGKMNILNKKLTFVLDEF